MERATEVYGCGSPQSTDITLNIQTTTGSNFSISLNGKNTIEHLKKLVSKKLRVCKDRICLLHRDRQLMDGTLEENGLLDGSRVILLPSVETGLLSSRPENSVMQALESLNDTQVNDFLSGKSPLNLTMRLGDHMMLIQLQLSTLTTTRTIRTSAPIKSSTTSASAKQDSSNTADPQIVSDNSSNNEKSFETDKPVTSDKSSIEKQRHIFNQQDMKMLQNAIDLCHTMVKGRSIKKIDDCDKKQELMTTPNNHHSNNPLPGLSKVENEQSPIKSLSNLVSSPIDASTSENKEVSLVNSVKSSLLDLLSKNDSTSNLPPIQCGKRDKLLTSASSPTPDSSLSDDSDTFTDQSSFLAENTIDEYPMENLFNSAVDKGLFEDQDESLMDREISNLATTSHGQESTSGTLPSFQSLNEPLKKRFQYLLHKTSKFKHPIGQNKQKAFMQSVVNKHKKRMQNRQDSNTAQPSRPEPYITNSRKLILQPSEEIETKTEEPQQQATPSTSKLVPVRMTETIKKRASPIPATIDTRALIEASKNLTQKLKRLSKEVLQNKIDAIKAERTKHERPGAVIESMKHHGKGIYSGTFSGTLNPALQDRYGRPKRDISTIIHILNDLLCASPPITLQREITHTCTSSSDKKCVGCTQQSCPLGQCDGHLASTSTTTNCSCKTKECNCNRLEPLLCTACAMKLPEENLCKKCAIAKSFALENTKTKGKLEQLRLVMQQKKQKREARKLKTLPYTNAPPKALPSPEQVASIQEEIETVA